MSKQVTIVNGWWEDDFPFDVNDDEQMDAVHKVLPNGYFLSVDLSAGYDAPDNDEKFIHLMNANHDE